MKVCLLNDSFPPVIDGVANVVMNYGKIMQEENLAEVVVATPRYPGTDYSNYPYKVIPYRSFDTTKIVKGYRAGNPINIREVKDIVDFKPDILHTHCPISSTVLARLVRASYIKRDLPIVFTYHTKFDVDIAKAVKAKFIQKETIKALVNNIEACDEVWVVSKGAGENLRSLGFEGNYHVVNNGVDFAKGRVEQELVNKVTKGYDLPQGVPVFLFVGRIIKYKGLPMILDAMKEVTEQGLEYRMVFVGSGPDEEELKEQARQLQIEKNCIFTGPIYDRNELRAWNTRADLFLFPSTYDTNGIVVREAAACGLASVLIEGSCAAEGISHDRNGFLIEENVQSLSTLLLRIGKNIDHMHWVGQNAMDEIYISWNESVHEAYERYQEVIENKKMGLYPTRTQVITEHLKQRTFDLFEGTKEMVYLPKRMFDGMVDNAEEYRMEFIEDMEGMKKISDNMKTEAKEKISKIIAYLKEE